MAHWSLTQFLKAAYAAENLMLRANANSLLRCKLSLALTSLSCVANLSRIVERHLTCRHSRKNFLQRNLLHRRRHLRKNNLPEVSSAANRLLPQQSLAT